jgi:hypothetical protein
MPESSIPTTVVCFAIASLASFVGGASSLFFGGDLGVGALMTANGVLFIALAIYTRRRAHLRA